MNAQSRSVGWGIFYACTAYCLLTVMDGIAKYMGERYALAQLVFFRSFFGFIPILPMLIHEGGFRALKTKRPVLHILRGFCVLGAVAFFFAGLRFLPMAETLTLAFTSPLFITLLSIPILGEKVGWHRWGAVIVGFIGVLVITRPGSDSFQPEALLPLAAGVSFALASVMTSLLARTEGNAAIAFYSSFFQCLPAAIALPWFWQDVATTVDWIWFVALGVLGGIGIQFLVSGFRHAPASVLAPFEYTSLLWATAIGWFGWREWPGDHVWTGAAILIASGLYITYREARRKKVQPATTPATSSG